MRKRTELQADADLVDLELYRIQCKLNALTEKHIRSRHNLVDAMRAVKRARNLVRDSMHPTDIKATENA